MTSYASFVRVSKSLVLAGFVGCILLKVKLKPMESP
jgi:hypothetical protein